MLVDSHTHIDTREFDGDRAEVIARARAAGIGAMVVVGNGRTLEEIARAAALADAEPDVWATAGVHPHDATVLDGVWEGLARLARHPRVVAVGEAGLDYYYDHSPRDVQRDAFRRQIRLANELGKPIVCHVRDAHAEALEILGEERAGTVVIHCFTGGPDEAAAYASRGYLVSFSGIITFKSAEAIRAAVKRVPAAQLLVETDAPYLAPVPRRGKRNEPSYLPHTAEVVAREAGLTVDELARVTAENAARAFHLTPIGPASMK